MKNKLKSICWTVTLFLILNPIITFALLIPYLIFSDSYTSSQIISITLFGAVFAVLTNLSITMGYHRLFSHKSYEAHPILQGFLLFIGAGAFQGSALKWSSDHRIHHRFEDTDKDPYNINRGFWHAHMGWMMKHETVSLPISAMDLEKNKLVMLQHKYYGFWSFAVGYIFPALVGMWMGNAFLGLAIAGGLRIFLTQQSTFFVNSLSHMHGKTTYSKEITARDSILVSVLTHGEGYHNFHHKFQFDYRNGIRWYHWDPTKWSIQTANLVGLAKKLKTVHVTEIWKARLASESDRFIQTKFYEENLLPMKNKIIESQARFEELKAQYKQASNDKIDQIKFDMTLASIELKQNMQAWKQTLKYAQRFYGCQAVFTDASRP
jgi:stearoyl-CoA desaturase (delta-9 desaturase)